MSAVQLQTHWKDDTLPAKVIKYLGPDWGLSKHTFRQAVRHFVVLSDKVGIRDQAYSNWLLAQQQAAEPTPPTLPTPRSHHSFPAGRQGRYPTTILLLHLIGIRPRRTALTKKLERHLHHRAQGTVQSRTHKIQITPLTSPVYLSTTNSHLLSSHQHRLTHHCQ